jgi:uncharacterized membrane protein
MDPTESNNDKINPEPTRYSSATLFALLIIAVQILVSLLTYPFLPDRVPSHWNAAGQIDGYAPKWVNAVLFPALSIGLYVLIRGLVALGPRLGQQNKRTNPELVNLILVGILLFELVIQLAVTAASFNLPVDINFIVSLFISALFMFIGNYLGKLRRNFWAGIRTPWTLVSDVVWERTHRLGGWLFVLAGFLGIIMSFIPPLRIWGVVGVLLVVVVILVAYSYLVYQQVETAGGESLSPPFD